jgi:hypothetical protein
MKRFLLLSAGLFCFIGKGLAQKTIQGMVLDNRTKEAMESAAIADLKTGAHTLTGRDGRFILKIPAPDSADLVISFVGYQTAHFKIRSSPKIGIIGLEKTSLYLQEITITNLPGISIYHSLSDVDMNRRPAKSAQDLLRLVPGLLIAQHQGGGKAEQIFLRGFDADHGTDVNVSVDGLPVNMVSHAHGQGYADLHFLIPETLAGYEFGKGPYYADRGDFTTAGYVAYHTKNVLDKNMIRMEVGEFSTGRLLTLINLLGTKARAKGQSAYIAGEALYSEGPFDYPEHFKRFNLFGKFVSALDQDNQMTLTLTKLSSDWRASGEIPNRAVAEGYIKDRFGVIDSAQGGSTSRTNLNIKLNTGLNHQFTLENQAYYSHYQFNLISNFTFYYFYPQTGDEFRQFENRDLMGYNSRLSKEIHFRGATLSSTIGLGIRQDQTHPSQLDHTLEGSQLISHLELGKVKETNLNGWLDETLVSGKWLFNLGLRYDYFHFYYLDMLGGSDSLGRNYKGLSPQSQKGIFSPKFNIQYRFSPSLQVYFKSGKGFHSNDSRIVIANQGYQILPAAYGVDLGMNWKPFPRLFINTAFWWLYLRQEFTYGADLGDLAVQPGGRTRRMGLDFSARYQIIDWLFANLNLNLAQPRDIDSTRGHDYLALAPTFTSTAGLDFKFNNGVNGGLSYRYLHNRAANSDYSLTALGYFVTDLTLNYTRRKFEVGIAIENLLNIQWNESQFDYLSRLKYESLPASEISYTPGTPFFAKLKFALFF